MRYEKTENIIKLALMMEGTAEGLSLQDISQAFGVSRRTSERMRDSIGNLFPIVEVSTGERAKRWKIPRQGASSLLTVSTQDLVDLDTAIRLLEANDLEAAASRLQGLRLKLKNLVGRGMRAVEEDLEAWAEAEGLAARPGPKRRIDRQVFEALRQSIMKCDKVRIHYRARGTGQVSRQIVCPYGFLYGHRHYLVAYSMNPQVTDYRLFILGNIEKVDPLDEGFDRDPGFKIKDYAAQSFGVFQEDPFEVVWRFNEEAAEDAKAYLFHPTQTFEDQPDGSVVVRFRAGGAQEMVWHLFTWGDAVEVVEPAHLRELLQDWKDV